MPDDLMTPAEPAADGRRRRSQRSRQAIVDALLELLREGEVRPSSTAVAVRAGLTQRTVFNHFDDMDELLAAAAVRQGQRIRTLLPAAGEGTLEQRVETFTTQLAILLEDTMHVRWAVLVHEVGEAAGVDVVRYVQDLVRRRVLAGFAPELDGMPAARRAQVLDAVDVLLDAGVWRIRRLQHGQGYEQARRAVAGTLLALLRSAS